MKAPFEGAFANRGSRARRALGLLLCSSALIAGLAPGCSSDVKSSSDGGGGDALGGAPQAGSGSDAAGGEPTPDGGSDAAGAAAAGAAGALGGSSDAASAAGTVGGGSDAAGAAGMAGTGMGGAGSGNDGTDEAGSSGARESAGAGGTAGGTSTAMWTMSAGKYQLSLGSTFLEIDPANGARITALRVGGPSGGNLVADATVTGDADNWGSTFWPSPQTWPWPPTATNSIGAINTLPYSVALDATANTLTLTSAVNAAVPKLQVIKKFSADAAKEAIQIDYTVKNGGSAAVTTAPWEVTRVPPGGITFYPPFAEPFYQPGAPTLTTTDLAGVTWYQHVVTDNKIKMFADGKDGWIAHAEGDLLLIKTFPDIIQSQAAANEAEIEIYAAPTYVEMETQGAVQTLAKGESLHWTVRWYARKLGAPAAIGSADLVAYVQNQIK